MNDFGLFWKNKKTEVQKIPFPFQTVETINLGRKTIGTLGAYREESKEWMNKLVWGDNVYVLSSLLPNFAGKINLIYIDPPFFTGTDMNITIQIGENKAVKEPSAIEEIAYRNMWKEGPSSFFQFMYDRLVLIRQLLTENGSLLVRFDYHYSHYVKAILDEVFGYENFVNEIIVNRGRNVAGARGNMEIDNDVIFWYSKTSTFIFNEFKIARPISDMKWTQFLMPEVRYPREREFLGKILTPPQGQHFSLVQEKVNKLLSDYYLRLHCKSCGAFYFKSRSDDDLFRRMKKRENRFKFYDLKSTDIIHGVERIDKCLECSSSDFAVQYLGSDEKKVSNLWTDIESYAHITGYPTENSEELLTRVISIASNENDIVADFFAGSGTTPVVAEKLGRKWIACDIGRFSIHTIRKRLLDTPQCRPFEILNLGKYERKFWMEKEYGDALRQYFDFILQLYHAKPVTYMSTIQGILERRAIHVGYVDYPVTKSEIEEATTEAKKNDFGELDILGWEFEMGLNEIAIKQIVESHNIKVNLKKIPTEAMDKRAVDNGDIQFFGLAFLETEIVRNREEVLVRLKNFIIPNPEEIPEEARNKIKKWSDYIDYWSVDWDYNSDVFHNQWQDFRTKGNLDLKLKSMPHHYDKGKHLIMIKVIDIFGNDTTKVEEVEVD